MTNHSCHNRQDLLKEDPLFAQSEAEKALVEDLLEDLAFDKSPISRITLGERAIGVTTEDGRCGTASNLYANTPEDVTEVHSFKGKTLGEAAKLLHHPRILCRALGVAALGAGTKLPSKLPSDNALELLMEQGRNKVVSLVGNFPGIARIREQARDFNLFELQDVPGAVPPHRWEEVLAETEVLGITGTAILTRAMAYYLEKSPKAFKVVVGPSTPMMRSLFSWGANVLGGSRISHIPSFEKGITQGLCYKDLVGQGLEHVALSRKDLP